MDFKKFIGENHPDPDTLLLNNFEQMCILAEKYAESLQLRKTDVNSRLNIYKIKSDKWDELETKIAKIYSQENESTNEEEGSLLDIGEISALAFGFL